MNLIACTTDCVYQKDGCCTLEQAATSGVPSTSGCIHYIPKHISKYGSRDKTKQEG